MFEIIMFVVSRWRLVDDSTKVVLVWLQDDEGPPPDFGLPVIRGGRRCHWIDTKN
jgi:hypothetical protein